MCIAFAYSPVHRCSRNSILLKHLEFFWNIWSSSETFSSERFCSERFDCFLKQSNVSEEIFLNMFFWNNWWSQPLRILIVEVYWLLITSRRGLLIKLFYQILLACSVQWACDNTSCYVFWLMHNLAGSLLISKMPVTSDTSHKCEKFQSDLRRANFEERAALTTCAEGVSPQKYTQQMPLSSKVPGPSKLDT
jgi:hypothetical protein